MKTLPHFQMITQLNEVFVTQGLETMIMYTPYCMSLYMIKEKQRLPDTTVKNIYNR